MPHHCFSESWREPKIFPAPESKRALALHGSGKWEPVDHAGRLPGTLETRASEDRKASRLAHQPDFQGNQARVRYSEAARLTQTILELNERTKLTKDSDFVEACLLETFLPGAVLNVRITEAHVTHDGADTVLRQQF